MSAIFSAPFGGPTLVVVDSLRVLVSIGAAALGGLYFALAFGRNSAASVRLRNGGAFLLLLLIFVTMLKRLGQPLSFPLVLGGGGVAVQLFGQFLDWRESRRRPKRSPKPHL